MTNVASGDPADAPGPRNLWRRLVAGQITEVCVLSYQGLYRDLPQTLGLEVIQYEAYIYDARGVVRTPEERERVARQLAAESRWLAIGGPRYWVEPFARRAGAILVTPSTFAQEAAGLDVAIDSAFRAAGRWIKEQARRRRPGEAREPMITDIVGAPYQDYSDDGRMTNAQLAAYRATMRDYLAGTFPEKTFLLSAEDLDRLQSVRALRRE